MIEFFVRRPVTTMMFVLTFVVMGLVSFTNLAIEFTPNIDFPIVSISTVYPGATPQEVETLIVDKVEDQVAELSEITRIVSYAYEGLAQVIVEFNLGADVNVKFIEVKDKVEAIINELPEDAEKPVVEKVDPLLTPVVYLFLKSKQHDATALYEYADKTLKNEFSKIAGVANVEILGGRERQIQVALDPLLMKRHYTSIEDVIDKIRNQNRNIPGGSIEKKQTTLNVRFVGEFLEVQDISNLVMSSEDGNQFQLKDIAVVEDAQEEFRSAARFNGQDGVALAVNKVSDGNAVNIARKIHKRLPSIQQSLPAGMSVEVATDTTTFIMGENREALFNIFLGILLTVTILYLFTGRWKLTFIGSIIIPSSVISTFFLMDLAGFSVNIMTLLALAVSLGTLIANAIVIIESVLAHLEKGKPAMDAAIDGTKEVANAVIASAGTNLVVFTPIAFMGGIVGQFFKSFGLTVVFATIFSLIASFSLTPMMCGQLLTDERHQKNKPSRNPLRVFVVLTDRFFTWIERYYRGFFDWMFRHKVLTLFLVAAMFLSAFLLGPYIDSEFYPASDQDQIAAEVRMPQGTKIEETLKVVRIIEGHAQELPEVKSFFSNLGDGGEENAAVIMDLIPQQKRKRSDLDIINDLTPILAVIPDAEIILARTGNFSEPGVGDVSINVYGEDYDEMIRISDQMKRAMEASGFFRSVRSSYQTPKNEIQFIPDQNKMMAYDVVNADVGAALRSSIYGDDTNIYKEKGEEYDINVELSEAYKQDMEDLAQIGIISRKGLVPITELGALRRTKASPTIRHEKRQRIIRLEGFLSKSTLGYMREFLPKEFEKIEMPPGHDYQFAGDAEYQDESNEEVLKAFVLAVVLTFMILAALLNSFIYPFPSFSLILISNIGVILSLFFLGESVNVCSMLGVVMLVGLVINDAILVIDYALMKMRDDNYDVKEAIWEGCSVKFRAIVLTTIAVILGTFPQLTSIMPMKTSMAAVIIGGMAAACVLTFVFIPVAFWYTERLRRHFQ